MNPQSDYRPSLADRVGMWIFIVAGAAIIVWSGISTMIRIFEVSLGESIPVTVRPMGLVVDAAIGADGATIPLQIETATASVSHMPGSAFGLEMLHQIIRFGATAAVVICLLLLARNALRGQIFSRRNTSLVATAGIVGLVGYGTALALEGAVGGEVLFQLAPDSGGFVFMIASPALFVIAAFALAVILTAYTVGARIQRETEGLV